MPNSLHRGRRWRFFGSGFFTLNTMLLVGLTTLSWVATYTGLLDYIKASAGNIDPIMYAVIGVAVAMLQFMILYTLTTLFSGNLGFVLWPFFVGVYLFLTVVSISFGFGFFWKYIAARSETSASAETSIIRVQAGLDHAMGSLEGLQSTLKTLTDLSTAKAQQEANSGGTCPGSPKGDGPRRQLRDSDAQTFKYDQTLVEQKIQSLKQDVSQLEKNFEQISKNDPNIIDPLTGTRIAFMTNLNKTLNITVNRLNNLRADPQLKSLRNQLSARAAQTSFTSAIGVTFTCPDQQLSNALNGVVSEIDGLPQLDQTQIVITEGAFAVAEAINRFKNTLFSLIFELKLPPSASEIRSAIRDTKGANEETAGLGRDDIIPLAIAIFVDLCIFAVAVRRSRGNSLIADNVIDTLNQAYVQAFGRMPTDTERIGPIQAIVFDHFGGHYAAVPLDFRAHKAPERARVIPVWARSGDEARHSENLAAGQSKAESDSDIGPPAQETQYLNIVFAALQSADLAEVVGLFSKVTSALSEARAKRKLERQHSIYAKAGAFRLYRFRRKAWNDVLVEILVGSAAGVTKLDLGRKGSRFSGGGTKSPNMPQSREGQPDFHEDHGPPPSQPPPLSGRDDKKQGGATKSEQRQDRTAKGFE